MDDNLETIYADVKAWVYFDGEEGEIVGVYQRCPECGKYVKRGKLLINMLGEIKLKEWKCKHHGEIYPYFDRNFSQYSPPKTSDK